MFLNLIIIKIDAKLVGDILNSDNTPIVNTHLDNVLIFDYLSLILSFEVAYLYHMHRKTNFYAVILATVKNNSLESFSLFLSPTSFVVSQILTDVGGGSRTSFV